MGKENDMKLICTYVHYKLRDDMTEAKIRLKSTTREDVKKDVWMDLSMIRDVADSASTACQGHVSAIQQSTMRGLVKEIDATVKSM
jgi:phage tail tube protein FII